MIYLNFFSAIYFFFNLYKDFIHCYFLVIEILDELLYYVTFFYVELYAGFLINCVYITHRIKNFIVYIFEIIRVVTLKKTFLVIVLCYNDNDIKPIDKDSFFSLGLTI